MALPDGYHDVAPGKLATIVTFLEMRSPREPAEVTAAPGVSLRSVARPTVDWYRDLFRRVGGDYLWASRLLLADDALERIITDSRVEIFALEQDGRDEGILELDFRTAAECELTFLGLTKATRGRGLGRWLMVQAIAHAWSHPIARFWLHTCDLDHPAALPFYVRSGFATYKRQVEIFDDPRCCGLLPRDIAPSVPLIE